MSELKPCPVCPSCGRTSTDQGYRTFWQCIPADGMPGCIAFSNKFTFCVWPIHSLRLDAEGRTPSPGYSAEEVREAQRRGAKAMFDWLQANPMTSTAGQRKKWLLDSAEAMELPLPRAAASEGAEDLSEETYMVPLRKAALAKAAKLARLEAVAKAAGAVDLMWDEDGKFLHPTSEDEDVLRRVTALRDRLAELDAEGGK